MPWTLREHQKEPDRLAHVLYWQKLEEPWNDVIWQNDGSLLSVLRYRGPDMESADGHELKALRARLHANVIKTLDAGWTVHAEERKHPAEPYTASRWTHPVAALVDEERRAQVGTPGSHFETSYHLTLTRQIPRSLGSWWQQLWWEHLPQSHAKTNVVTAFREEIDRIERQLAGVFPEVERLEGSGLLAYLKSTVSPHHQPYVGIPEPPWYLNFQLTDTSFQTGVTPKLGNLWLRTVVVKNAQRQVAFPETTYPGILDVLHDLPLEYRFVARWIPLAYAKAKKELDSLEDLYRGQHKSFMTQFWDWMSGTPSDKHEQAADDEAYAMSEARAMLERGVCTWGYLTLSVTVWDADLTEAERKRELVEQVLRAKGFVASVELIDAAGAWWGSLPGDSYNNVEKPMLHSLNFCDLMATTSVWAGPTWVSHLQGPPHLVATGRGQTPFRETTYEGDVGDVFLIGPKGSGKSTDLAFMALQWQRYERARVVALDKGASLKAATLAMDGQWVDLAPMTARRLQPLARIEDPEERAWGVDLIEDILELEGFPRDPALNRELWQAMTALVPFTREHRTLSGYQALVQSQQVQDALSRYLDDGPFPLLDGDQDWLRVTHWTCFEMQTLLDDFARYVHPVFRVVARRIEKALDGAPTLLSLDECHAYFLHPVLAPRQLQWSKTLRRLNCMIAYGTQNLLDMKRSPVGEEIIQACPTRKYFPNPHATEPGVMALYQEFGLTPRQCQLIASALPKREYYYQGQQGNRLVSLDLGPVTLAYCGRSRTDDLARLRQIEAERTEPFGVAWLRSEGLETHADLLGEAYENELGNRLDGTEVARVAAAAAD